MTVFRLRYVQAFRDRHGKQRYYYRAPGKARIPLTGEPGSAAFMSAYHAAAKEEPARQIGAERSKAGTINALVAAYYQSTDFKQLAAITQSTYRNVIERIRQAHGAKTVAKIESHHIRAILDKLADKPGAAYNFRRAFRVLMRFAIERGYRKDNPMLGVRPPKKKGDGQGYRPWTEDSIAMFEKRWPIGTREHLALMLLLYTAQRRFKIVVMGRQHVVRGKLRVDTGKGGRIVLIPIHPRLQAAIDACPSEGLTFLMTQQGAPFSAAGFTNWFTERSKMAGIEGQASPHGLRKAAARRLAEANNTAHGIMSITGHRTLSEVSHYTASANMEALAESAMESIGGTKAVKPQGLS